MTSLHEALQRTPGIVAAYLVETTTVAAVLVDGDRRIVDCNSAFVRLVGSHGKPIGNSVAGYLYDPAEQIDVVDVAERYWREMEDSARRQAAEQLPAAEHSSADRLPDGSRQLDGALSAFRFSFQPKGLSLHTVRFYAARIADKLLFLGESPTLGESEIIHKMSEMNHEITNLSRETAKKNAALERANAQIKQLMNTDHLTGLANRRHFSELSGRARSLAERRGFPLSVIMIDIDHFKAINDRYGHHGGDRVLVAAAELLSRGTRNEDIVARWGGEEFLVMLQDADAQWAVAFGERIRQSLSGMEVERLAGATITASFGVAQMHPGENLEALIIRADQAMYRAKRQGRNLVCVADDPA